MTSVVLRIKGKRHNCVIEADGDTRLVFSRAPFSMKNEIKAFAGARWNPDHKQWSIANNERNMFQLRAIMVEPTDDNPYEWFERPLDELEAPVVRPLKDHQIEMVRKALTYRYQIFAADCGLGKTLVAFEIVERLKLSSDEVWFVGPRPALESVSVDTRKWGGPDMVCKTYERFVIDCDDHIENPPRMIVFDECSGLKNSKSIRARAAQRMSNAIRKAHGMNGYVILMSGTVVAKRPSDIWSQAEIAWPGFLREGSLVAFESRYANVVTVEDFEGVTYRKIDGWKEKEVSKISQRLSGLMSIYLKADLLTLPPRTYHTVECEVTPRIRRVAKALVDAAPNVITGLTWLRALSSGFQYKEGEAEGNERSMVQAPCPKDEALCKILGEEESVGRTIVFASFQGSIDRVKRICQGEGWNTIVIDGRGWNCYDSKNELWKGHFLDYWANNVNKTVLVGNPASCKFGLTLNEAKTITVFDQSFSAENRLQSLARNYRIGQTKPTRVIDLIHLEVDSLILQTLQDNKRLEDLSLGAIRECLN